MFSRKSPETASIGSIDKTADYLKKKESATAADEISRGEHRAERALAFEETKQKYPEEFAILNDSSPEGWIEMEDKRSAYDEPEYAPDGTFFLTRPASTREGGPAHMIHVKVIDDSVREKFEELLKFKDEAGSAWRWIEIKDSI